LFQPGELQAHADKLIEASLCVRTRSIYQRLTRDYVAFASKDGNAAFGTESVKCYLAKLHLEGKAHSTLLTHISALKFHCKRFDLDNGLESPAVKAVLRGAMNLTVKSRTVQEVLDVGKLVRLGHAARQHFGEYEAALVQCMFSVAFFGFLRVGEYTVTSAGHAMKMAGCSIVGGCLVLTIPSSKRDNSSINIKLHPFSKYHSICPVRCFVRYRGLRPTSVEPTLFVDSGGLALRPTDVNRYLRVLCGSANLECLSSHAFRVGGATWAASQGWPDSVIRAHGRWRSDAFLRYIRPV
jgi:hypothetical protein